MIVVITLNDFSKCYSWGQAEKFPASQHLSRELIKECESLFIGSVFAKPGNWMVEGGLRYYSAYDGY